MVQQTNELQKLIEKYPNKSWDIEYLVNNPNISLDFIKNNFDWCMKSPLIFEHREITLDFIDSYIKDGRVSEMNHKDPRDHRVRKKHTYKTVYNNISQNPNLTVKFIKEHTDYKWNWAHVSCNRNITMEDIENNPNLPWIGEGVAWNPNLTTEYIEKLLKNPRGCYGNAKNREFSWGLFWLGLSERNLTVKFIEKHSKLPWDWWGLSRNPNITMEYIEKHPEFPWDWRGVSYNSNLTMEYIEEHPELPWHWDEVSRNTNITMKDIENHPELPWVWRYVSLNPNLTMEYVDDHPGLPWDWSEMSRNKFKLHSNYKGPPTIHPLKKKLHMDFLINAWCIPPNVSNLPVLKRGGVLCLEDAMEAMEIIA